MASENVLVVEDEEDIRELLIYNLSKEGYRAHGVGTGEDALRHVRARPPHLIVLDLMLPGIDGLALCKLLKSETETRAIPIVMVTAKSEDADIVAGLELGADDYVTKPFRPKVFLARVRAVLRRNSREPAADDGLIEAHGIRIDPGRYEVRVADHPVQLTATEFRILHYLIRRAGWVFTRQQIVKAVHGDDYPVTDRSIDVQIVNLRRKLGEAGSCIETIRGIGYRFQE